jgi:hypothetical protein
MREELLNLSQRVLGFDYLKFRKLPDAKQPIVDRVINIAQYTAMMRGTVARDRFTREITHKPFHELGTRLTGQFCKLLYGLALLYKEKEVTNRHITIAKHLGLGTIPSRLESVIASIWKKNPTGDYTADEIAEMIGLPRLTAGIITENLLMLKILSKTKGALRTAYVIREEIRDIINKGGIYGER